MASSTQIEMLAAAWIARRDRGGFSAAEQAELTQWLEGSTANRVAFIRLEAAWREANRLKVLGAGMSPGVMPAPGRWRQSPFFSRWSSAADTDPSALRTENEIDELAPVDSRRQRTGRLFKALAACLVFAVVASSHWHGLPRALSYRTEIGGLSTIPIADGSKLTLNTNSQLRVVLSEAQRRVDLDQGEAFFEVAKDPRRPFTVNVGDLRVVAVGTKFSVRREVDELRVVVTEGRVQMAKREDGRDVPIAHLNAGSIAHVRGDDVLVKHQPLSQVEEFLSWRTGFVVFHGTALADSVAELNRYNTRKILIKDPAIAAIRISGNFRATNGDAFARLLEDGFAIRADVGERQIVLSAE
jgi:transmembrane sensor